MRIYDDRHIMNIIARVFDVSRKWTRRVVDLRHRFSDLR